MSTAASTSKRHSTQSTITNGILSTASVTTVDATSGQAKSANEHTPYGTTPTGSTIRPRSDTTMAPISISHDDPSESPICPFALNPQTDSHYWQAKVAHEFDELNQNRTECIEEFLQNWDHFTSYYPNVPSGNTDSIDDEYFDLQIFDYNASDNDFDKFDFIVDDYSYWVQFPSDALGEEKGLSLVVYIVKATFLPQSFIDSDGNMLQIGSRLLSINLFKNNGTFSYTSGKFFDIVFSILPNVQGTRTCQYVTQSGSWSTEGCNVSASNDSHVTCSCDHMTNFAVMMQLVDVPIPKDHEKALNYLTYICMSISIICLIATLILYGITRLYKNVRIAIHANLAASLLLAQLVFVTGIDAKTKDSCIAVTVMLHYLWLVVFLWMLMEGIHLYLKVTPHIACTMKLRVCMPIAWGAPSLIVFTTLGMGIKDNAITDSPCWLPIKDGFIYAFVGPAFITEMVNAVFLAIILRKFLALKTNQDRSEFERLKASVRAIVILMPLLGVTWIFGLLQFDVTSSLIFGYLFIICNGLQGLSLFITQCLLDDDVKVFLRQKIVRGRVGHSNDTENGT